MHTFSRDKAKEFIISLGGKSPVSLSKKTSILVTGPGAGPVKLQKALELGISTMSEQEFIDLITKSENNN
jgi:DNA ligase (NAD+)